LRKPIIIVKVTKTEFEIEDGTVHPIPSIEKFQNTVRYTVINAGGDDKVHVEKSTGGRLRNQNQTKTLLVDFCKF